MAQELLELKSKLLVTQQELQRKGQEVQDLQQQVQVRCRQQRGGGGKGCQGLRCGERRRQDTCGRYFLHFFGGRGNNVLIIYGM